MIDVKGNLLENDCDMIVQQLNCLCVRPHGLSEDIGKKYSYADVYNRRRSVGTKNLAIPEDRPEPGTVVLSRPISYSIPSDNKEKNRKENDNKENNPIVAGIFGQYDFGKLRYRSYRPQYKTSETRELREFWFENGLNILRDWLIKNNHGKNFKIGFPYKIACGLAGGNWDKYRKMLERFSNSIECQVFLYHLG